MKERKYESPGAVQPVQFSPIVEQPVVAPEKQQLETLGDVTLRVSFELGRTEKKVRDILELKQGSVLRLNKLAGESVDVLANDQSIALGELVVLDEKFSVRITEILSKKERERKLT
ncbi:flagellar motor switch protein FliN [Bacillus sp. B15-48]|uniref:flagellar motor switch protein FliN n=1 Tax=Bacillus sp. B15-48 TaxID=1548601 RepID=UPI00193F9F54